MLFNSFSFLFLYLPVVLAGYFLLLRWRPAWIAGWLALASLFFYGYWDARYLPLLIGSIVFNYWCAQHRRLLGFGVVANLALLAYYKYANFFLPGQGWDIILPVGISFFTFTQIAYLVDCHRGGTGEYRLVHYTLFVSYFPHLIAGPVLHHKEMMPQFDRPARFDMANIAIGLSIFVVGLAKKVLLADPISVLVAPVFAPHAQPQLVEAWIGTLAYTFQLYFDFSGYSDMAIGLSRLFGVRLPLNFNSPYKAVNISEFWRRWHMTLSRFLRDYLYVPLGGNRHGSVSRYRNLMATMLLGGLWHGAGWTFVAWGALHGVYLVIHHGWQALSGWSTPRWWGRWLTLLAVMVAWVLFRAPDMATAGDVLRGLAGLNGVSLPRGMAPLGALGWHPAFDGIRWIDVSGPALPALLLAMALALYAPNTQEWFDGSMRWTPALWRSALMATVFLGCLFNMNRVSEFLYFQF
ncbi:MBOAT family protein [Pseudoduganella sp. FT25W]|uniref:Probable alginate O-acetylase AlgI n=1 Tax=Duganella alba TaxID=2666081 RepID=A0A6L5QAV4_9BURK|nr:MBOAT family protein [Duganella alba]MRX06442.1 MBOAT family protein [Duganella alba]MRX14836.1 MBOAT family protein [Duganella alba]